MKFGQGLAIVLTCALPGCGMAQPAVDPRTATLERYHADPAVAPPFHSEWRLTIAPDHAATYTAWAGYPGTPGVVPSQRRFVVPAVRYDTLIAAMAQAGIATRDWSNDPSPPGSPTDSIEVSTENRAIKIPAGQSGEAARRLEPVFRAFDGCRSPG